MIIGIILFLVFSYSWMAYEMYNAVEIKDNEDGETTEKGS